MSCRVLGRGVEKATLSVVLSEARRRGVQKIIGRFCPSAKNGTVRDHYSGLGFSLSHSKEEHETIWTLEPTLAGIDAEHIRIKEITSGRTEDLCKTNRHFS